MVNYEEKFHKYTKKIGRCIKKNPYLVLVIFLAIALSVFFYNFWTESYILRSAGDPEIYRYDLYLKGWTNSFHSSLMKILPGQNPTFTFMLLIPFYPFMSSYRFLILIQVLTAGSSIILLFLLAREYLPKIQAFLITIAYTSGPLFIYSALLDGFKPAFLGLPLVFLFFLAYKKRLYKIFLVSSILLVFSKMYFMPILALFGLYLFFKGEDRKYYLPILLVGVGSSIFYLSLLKIHSGTAEALRNNYVYGPFEIIKNPSLLMSNIKSNLQGLIHTFSYAFYIPFLAPEIIFISLPKILDSAVTTSHPFCDKTLLLNPLIYIGTIIGIKRMNNFLKKYISIKHANLFLILLISSMIILHVNVTLTEVRDRALRTSGNPTINCGCCEFEESSLEKRYSSLERIIEKIPRNESVYAPLPFRVFLLDKNISIVGVTSPFMSPPDEANYIIYDKCLRDCKLDSCDIYEIEIGGNPDNRTLYNKIYDENNLMLLKKRNSN